MLDEHRSTGSESRDAIRVNRVDKIYGARKHHRAEVRALDGVDLAVAPDELVVLLGPSGCGKTTLLRSVAGLVDPDTGTIDLYGERMFDSAGRMNVPPEGRPLSMVFQSYALWPHMTVLQNVQYPLRSTGVNRRTARSRAKAMLDHIGLGELAGAYPSQLSGGQQQRVALVRALVDDRKVILFDEPLSNVDAKVRQQLRLHILETKLEYRFSGLYVTHDQEEAIEIADRIAVMRSGRILQVGSPEEVYRKPASAWIAKFIGQADHFQGVVSVVERDHVVVKFPVGSIRATIEPGRSGDFEVGRDVDVLIRPDRWRVLTPDEVDRAPNALDGSCLFSLFRGNHFATRVRIGPVEVTAVTSRRHTLEDPIDLDVHPDDVMVFPMDAGAQE